MKWLRFCYDPRVVAAAIAVGVIVAIVAPQLLAAAVPFLVVLVCPLSMLLMMKGMEHAASRPVLGEKAGDRKETLREELAANSRRQAEIRAEMDALSAGRTAGSAAARTAGPP